MKYIEEKLTAADPASKWISDFVKSDNPKFAGKSKKERIQQALGAYYAKKRGTNEETEQVDEVNRNKTKTDDYGGRYLDSINRDKEIKELERKISKMSPNDGGGRYLAGLKLDKMKAMKEEAKQVDEAAKGPLHVVHVSFTNLAAVGPHRSTMNYKVHAPDKEAAKRYAERDLKHKSRSNLKAHSARLVKEEVEQVDEVDYKKYLKASQEKRPLTMKSVDSALAADKAGDPNPLRKLQNTNAARKFAQKQLTKKFNASQPARPFPVYEPGRTYVGDSVELDGPTIDEARRMSAAEKLGRAFDSEQQRSALSRQRGLDLLKQKDTEKMQNKPASGDMTKLKKEETEESTMKYIEEKLTAADPASKWISDFVKSDNPKFAGKSKKERIQQALGAYYAKKRGTNEEVEQMDEGKDVDHAKLIANSLAATHPNFRVSSYNGDHGRAHVVHHKSDTRNFKNGEQLMGPNIQLQHNHETNKVHMEMQGDYDNVPDRDEETHHPDKAHEAAHKMFKPAIDLIHTTDKKTTNEEVEQMDEGASHFLYSGEVNGKDYEYAVRAHHDLTDDVVHKALKRGDNDHLEPHEIQAIVDSGGEEDSHVDVTHNGKKYTHHVINHQEPQRLYGEEVVLEEPKDAADVGEYDYEGDMAKSQLRSIMANSKRMHDMLEDTTNLPEWVQSKITLAEDYVVTAANYMEGEMNEAVERVDELKKSTLQSYAKKASKEMKKAHDYHQMRYGGRDGSDSEYMKKTYPAAVAKYDRRDAGVAKAKQKLAKEAVEGKVAVTPKEKSLAAHHGDKTKITYGDVIKARLKSAAAKKMGK
jgi:hypothetical protein